MTAHAYTEDQQAQRTKLRTLTRPLPQGEESRPANGGRRQSSFAKATADKGRRMKAETGLAISGQRVGSTGRFGESYTASSIRSHR